MNLNNLIFLKNSSTLNFDDLPDGLIVVINTRLESDSQLIQQFNQQKSQLASLGIELFITTNTPIKTDSEIVLFDKDQLFYNYCPKLSPMGEFCESIIYFQKTGQNLKHLFTRVKPSSKTEWINTIIQFGKNYKQLESQDGLWKFGQIVPETGEYLCTDCGYITNLTAGSVFPICEVCLSGDPSGPCDTGEEFWRKL